MTSENSLRRFYDVHAHIYDATRWAFLFGREELVSRVGERGAPQRILEIGCGTGFVLERMALRYPASRLHGVDLSEAMLVKSRRRLRRFGDRVSLSNAAASSLALPEASVDAFVFSYSLSMMGEERATVLGELSRFAAPEARVHVVDFHESPSLAVRKWMALHGVDIRGEVRSDVATWLQPLHEEIRPAFGGLWSWCVLEAAIGDR